MFDGENILVIGMVSYPPEPLYHCTTDQQWRDHSRIECLRQQFGSAFSIANHKDDHSCHRYHCFAHKNRQGAQSVVEEMLNRNGNEGKKLNYILVEYIRMVQTYYRPLLIGENQRFNTPGAAFCRFINYLREHDKLAHGCQLIFARHDKATTWPMALKTFEQEFGKPVDYIGPLLNPLWIAGDLTEGNYPQKRPYKHREELKSLTFGITPPFCHFVFSSTQTTVHRRYVPPRAVAAVVTATERATTTPSPSNPPVCQ